MHSYVNTKDVRRKWLAWKMEEDQKQSKEKELPTTKEQKTKKPIKEKEKVIPAPEIFLPDTQ
jgi:hypothetical protein